MRCQESGTRRASVHLAHPLAATPTPRSQRHVAPRGQLDTDRATADDFTAALARETARLGAWVTFCGGGGAAAGDGGLEALFARALPELRAALPTMAAALLPRLLPEWMAGARAASERLRATPDLFTDALSPQLRVALAAELAVAIAVPG